MDERWFREVIAKEKNSFFYKLFRGLLRVMSLVYGAGNSLRNKAFLLKIRKIRKVSTPVISIGNVTTGGTGKTPFVIWVSNFLVDKGFQPAILTRGYKAGKGKLTDEPAILAKGCSKAKVLVNSNRYAGAKKAINEYCCDIMVMDDGFQHRQLHRDINIAIIDATSPFGYEKLLPAGLLREPIVALKRADAFVISRCDQVNSETISDIENKLTSISPDCIIAHAKHSPKEAIMLKNSKASLEDIRAKKIFAFCGIGNPNAFFKTLEDLKLDIAGTKTYNDHHNYSNQDLQDVYEQARYLEADIILTTQKDWVKTALLSLAEDDIEFAYLSIEMEFVKSQDRIENLISKVIEKKQHEQ